MTNEDNGPPDTSLDPKRYEIRYGKWGAYFFDKKWSTDMPLQDVLDQLNLHEERKKHLKYYMEKAS